MSKYILNKKAIANSGFNSKEDSHFGDLYISEAMEEIIKNWSDESIPMDFIASDFEDNTVKLFDPESCDAWWWPENWVKEVTND